MSGDYLTVLVLEDDFKLVDSLEEILRLIHEHDCAEHCGAVPFQEWKDEGRITVEQKENVIILFEAGGWGCCIEEGEKYLRERVAVKVAIEYGEGTVELS